MSDRTVVVRLVGMVGQYRAAMSAAAASTRALDSAVLATNRNMINANTRMLASQRKAAGGFGSAISSMRGMLLGVGLPLAIGAVVKSFLDFEQQMAHVTAVADRMGKTADGMRMMRTAALDAGQAYGFTATEVAKAEEALSKAGRSTAQILGGDLTAALVLAAAGTVTLDMAAETIAVTMSQFSDEVAHGGLTAGKVADQLSKAANATVSDVAGMATALKYVGPQAAGLGLSLEDTVTTLSLFNQAGLDADMAGTNMRGMLTGLMSPSKMVTRELEKLNIELYDVKGSFIGMPALAGELNRALGPGSGKTDEQIQLSLGRIATNAQLPGFITLANKGAEGWYKMQAAIQAQSTAQDVAQAKLNSLTGDLKKFGSAINTAAIRTLEGLSPHLRSVVGDLTDMTKWFGNAGNASQLAMMGLGAYMLMGRQRLPRMTQGMQGAGINRALAGEAQAGAIAARGAANAALMQARMTPIGMRAPGSMLAVQNLRNEAKAAQATAGQYRGLSGAIGRTQAEWRAANGMMGRSIVGLRGLSSAAGAAGSGLMGALGGPAGLAIMGTLVGLTYFAGQVEGNKRKVQDLADANVILGDSFRKVGHATEETNRMFAEGPLAEAFTGPGGKAHLGLQSFGFSRDQVAGAAAGTDLVARAAIRNRYQREIEQSSRRFYETLGTQGAGDTAKLERSLEAVEDAWKRSDIIAKQAEEDERKALDVGMKRFGLTNEGLTEAQRAMVQGVTEMEAPGAKIADVLKAMGANVDTLRGSYLAAGDAQAEFFGSALGTRESFTGKTGKAEKPRISFVTKQFDPRTEAGAAQHAQASKTVSAAFDMGKTAEARGLTELPASYKKINAAALLAVAAVSQAREEFVKQYAPLVGGAKAAERLADSYGLVTGQFAKSIGAEGMEDTVAGFRKLGTTIQELPGGKVVISADTEPALRKVVGLKAGIQKDKITGEVTYTFPSAESLAAAVAKANAAIKPPPVDVPVTYHPMMGKPSGPAASQAPKGVTVENTTTTTVDLKLGKMPVVPDSEGKVNLNLGPMPPIPAQSMPVNPFLAGGVPQVADQHMTVFVHTAGSANAAEAPRRWGGIDSYAKGGIHAKIGKGDLIRWAEPETGGEAYIPRKGDASRSKLILETAASWYGLGVHKMATGGVHSFAAGAVSSTNAPLGDFLSRYMGAPDTWSTQRTAAMMDQRDATFAVKDAEKALTEVRNDKKHTTLELRKAEAALADARRDLATSNTQLAKAKMAPRDQFKASLDTGVKSTASFIANLNALSSRGYGALAMQLLQMGGPEAEAIAASAKGWSAATAGRVNKQVQTAQGQQKTLENMPAMLAIRSAIASGQSYSTLLGSGQFSGQDINAALALMETELGKTATGQAMLASMRGNTAAALGAQVRGFAAGGIAAPGTMYRFAEPSTGGEAVIPRFGTGAVATLNKAAAWHGKTLSELGNRRSQPARPVQVQITVRGEGELARMIETRVDGALVQVGQAITRGRSVRS